MKKILILILFLFLFMITGCNLGKINIRSDEPENQSEIFYIKKYENGTIVLREKYSYNQNIANSSIGTNQQIFIGPEEIKFGPENGFK